MRCLWQRMFLFYDRLIKYKEVKLMSFSILRSMEKLELSGYILFCFCINILLSYSRTINADSNLIWDFFKQLYDIQIFIVMALTLTVCVFHHKITKRKKVEIRCRTLVGATTFSIIFRYFADCMIILCLSFIISALLNTALRVSITGNIYLSCVFIFYMLITLERIRYENL